MKTAFTISAIITILCLINMLISIVGFEDLILATYFGAVALLMMIIMKLSEQTE
tara:strand:+ start:118 stop:279 length:162 start_codon:yes stop_codon:yes gene_type:complete